MELQLELVPFHYHNTPGFDVKLIGYINHITLVNSGFIFIQQTLVYPSEKWKIIHEFYDVF
ncbi:hypothetical protein RZN25_07945 [Bacillaceae bacterium S4-13-56]